MLEQLLLGDPDTGKGGSLTDEGVLNSVKACPSLLVVVSLDAARNLTDAAPQGICKARPRPESLRITGHDKSPGSIKSSSLTFLVEHPDVEPKLKHLVLLDQFYYDDPFKKAMKKLAIAPGNTDSSSWRDKSSSSVMMNGKEVDYHGRW